MTPRERIQLQNAIGISLQGQFTTTEINHFLSSYGIVFEHQAMAKSKKLYAVEAISDQSEEVVMQIARDLDVLPKHFAAQAFTAPPTAVAKPAKTMENNGIKKIFISHSNKDAPVIEKIIDLLRIMGVSPDSIFCSSFQGYGINLGEDLLEALKRELSNDVLVLFVLSDNFYASPVCLCEMGAAWVTTRTHIPVLIPPFEFKDIKGVFPQSLGVIVTDKIRLYGLKEAIEQFLGLPPLKQAIWERERDNILRGIEQLLVTSGK